MKRFAKFGEPFQLPPTRTPSRLHPRKGYLHESPTTYHIIIRRVATTARDSILTNKLTNSPPVDQIDKTLKDI